MRTTLPLLAFLATPILEIATFILVGQRIGVGLTLVLVLISGFTGLLILRRQGLGALKKLNRNLRRESLSGEGLADGFLIAMAAMLLIIPGFLTDIVALFLLLPPIRKLIWRRWASSIQMRTYYTSGQQSDPNRSGRRSKGDFVDLSPDDFHRDDHPDVTRLDRPD
ncbi:UPF0716 protein FxsA [Rhizobium sp. SG_E_25_P2]|jgi:UPF0716 protein FxsA|uniref:FxsA family protein n=1 Tax=Rhizobium sp. SG_E_25_P2 TaxID=2879942 RepID=UPI0024745580|nr:FxsA family protein [Rhizobium sp. SG_E_25_P2]MDH6269335.1 UPF0716 protein FxsA [Rhizobium sp. SG_E_25_P2]